MRKILIVSALALVILFALPSGVVLVPSLRTTAVETVTRVMLSADRVTIGAVEVGEANDVVVSNTAVQTSRGRFDVGRMAMTPQLWRGMWRGQGPLDYVDQVRVEDVAGTVAAFGRDVPVKLVDLTVKDRARRHSVAVSADDAERSTREAAPAPTDESEAEETTTVLRSRLLVRGQAIVIEVELDARKLLAGEQTEFAATVTADLLSIEAQGTVRDPQAMQVDGRFSVKTGPLDQLVAWIVGEAPESLAGLGAFDGQGRIRMAGETVELADLRLDLIDSQVRGDVTITRGESVTGIDGQLAIDRIDLNRLMAAMPADNAPAADNAEPTAIDVAFLDGLRGLLKITVAEVLAGPAVASDLGVDLTFAPGSLDLSALLTTLGGEVRLASQVASRDGAPDVSATLAVSGLGLQEAATTFAGPDSGLELAGTLSAESMVRVAGATTVELERSLALSVAAQVEGMALTAGAPVVTDGQLQLTAKDLKSPVELSGGANVFSRQLTLSANAAPVSQLLAGQGDVPELLSARMVSGGHRIDAMVMQPAAGATPELQLHVSGRSLKDLLAWLQAAPAAEQSNDGILAAYSLVAAVSGGAEQVDIRDIDVKVDDLTLTGEAALELAGVKPRLVARLDAGRIDLTPYLSVEGAAPAEDRVATATSSDDADLSGLSALRSFDAQVSLQAEAVVADKIALGATALTARVEDGAADVELTVAEVYGGDITLRAGVNGGATDQPIDARLSFQGIDPGVALRTMFSVDGFGGIASGEFKLATSGSRLSQLQDRLEANGRFVIEDALVPPQFALLSGSPLAPKPDAEGQNSRVAGVLLYGRDSRRADMQWQRGEEVVAEFSLFEKKKKKRETRLTIPDQRDG